MSNGLYDPRPWAPRATIMTMAREQARREREAREARELTIEQIVARAVERAIAKNSASELRGSHPFRRSVQFRQLAAIALYRDHEWSIGRIVKFFGMTRVTIEKYVRGSIPKHFTNGERTLFAQLAEPILREHGVTLEQLIGPRGNRAIYDARCAVWTMLRERGWSLCQIGQRSNRHHSSVLHGIRRWKKTHAEKNA